MIKIFSYALSFITVLTMYLAGNKKRSAWKLGLFNQVLWFTYICMTAQWGLLIMTTAITGMYIRNLFKWKV